MELIAGLVKSVKPKSVSHDPNPAKETTSTVSRVTFDSDDMGITLTV